MSCCHITFLQPPLPKTTVTQKQGAEPLPFPVATPAFRLTSTKAKHYQCQNCELLSIRHSYKYLHDRETKKQTDKPAEMTKNNSGVVQQFYYAPFLSPTQFSKRSKHITRNTVNSLHVKNTNKLIFKIITKQQKCCHANKY